MNAANSIFPKSPQGIGRKWPLFPSQPLGNCANAVPSAAANAPRYVVDYGRPRGTKRAAPRDRILVLNGEAFEMRAAVTLLLSRWMT